MKSVLTVSKIKKKYLKINNINKTIIKNINENRTNDQSLRSTNNIQSKHRRKRQNHYFLFILNTHLPDLVQALQLNILFWS